MYEILGILGLKVCGEVVQALRPHRCNLAVRERGVDSLEIPERHIRRIQCCRTL